MLELYVTITYNSFTRLQHRHWYLVITFQCVVCLLRRWGYGWIILLLMINNQHGRHLCYTTIPSRYLRRIIMIKYWSINLTTNFNCRSHLNIRLLINGIYCLEITISNKIKCIDSLNLYDISTLSLFMTALWTIVTRRKTCLRVHESTSGFLVVLLNI
jgi:hypothetical protein